MDLDYYNISAEKLDIQLGRTEKVNAEISPANASNKNVTWVSENEEVAVVDNNGNIKAKSAGQAKVYAKCDNDISSYVDINVYEVFPEQIEINSKEIELDKNDTYKLAVKVLPENTNNKSLTYECDNDILTIKDDGTIAPVKSGKAVITITTSNGISDTVNVNVYSKGMRQAVAGGTVLGLGACVGGAYTYKRRNKSFRK
ncbi:Ig-like domain-containing protein [uncultured Clostridium sp.]|uniref:Ig-like domain-containing protein n=1 Tax=uncultured Clostridium sp. TaxID=59620 RepID=UPI0025E4EF6A|nr:Ig-like domain-containing protein [uncultured Clostridium sp.]